jgi:hypothetical protein
MRTVFNFGIQAVPAKCAKRVFQESEPCHRTLPVTPLNDDAVLD